MWVAVADRTRAVFELPNDLQYRRSVQLKLANRSGERVRFRLCTKSFIAFWRFIAIPSGNDVYGPNVSTLHPQHHTGATSADENSLVAGIEPWRWWNEHEWPDRSRALIALVRRSPQTLAARWLHALEDSVNERCGLEQTPTITIEGVEQ